MPSVGRGLRALSIATVVVLGGAFALVAFWVPETTEGARGQIFYVHVPMAIVALVGFVAAGVMGFKYLTTGDRLWDLRSYVAIHMSLILGVGVLITGGIWGKAAWGHWWNWDDPTLVSFLIVFLLYATYQPLRFSIEDPERQARYASVFAILGAAFVPLNFAAVRMTNQLLHPRTLGAAEGGMFWEMAVTFIIALIGMSLLYLTLWRFEMTAKLTRGRIRAMRRSLGTERAATTRSAAPQVTV